MRRTSPTCTSDSNAPFKSRSSMPPVPHWMRSLSVFPPPYGTVPSLWTGGSPAEVTRPVAEPPSGQGDASGGRHLWAVICPVVTKATPSLGSSWRRRGVRVYAETDREAGASPRPWGGGARGRGGATEGVNGYRYDLFRGAKPERLGGVQRNCLAWAERISASTSGARSTVTSSTPRSRMAAACQLTPER